MADLNKVISAVGLHYRILVTVNGKSVIFFYTPEVLWGFASNFNTAYPAVHTDAHIMHV